MSFAASVRGLLDSVRRRRTLRGGGRLASPVPVRSLPVGAGVAVLEEAR
jgi:hypothetical protein